MNEYMPAYNQSIGGRERYFTNLTRVSTLVCDPRMTLEVAFARAFGNTISLSPAPEGYTEGVGNLNLTFAAYMVYNYAVQQAHDVIGVFRPNLLLGLAPGNAVLQTDSDNSANGTIPRSSVDIARTLV